MAARESSNTSNPQKLIPGKQYLGVRDNVVRLTKTLIRRRYAVHPGQVHRKTELCRTLRTDYAIRKADFSDWKTENWKQLNVCVEGESTIGSDAL